MLIKKKDETTEKLENNSSKLVSIKQAEKLKQIGYNMPTYMLYTNNKILMSSDEFMNRNLIKNSELPQYHYSAPSLLSVIEWAKEFFKIFYHINIKETNINLYYCSKIKENNEIIYFESSIELIHKIVEHIINYKGITE